MHSVCLHGFKLICPDMSITDEPCLHSAAHRVICSALWETESLSVTLIKLTQVPFPMRANRVVCVQQHSQ